MFVLDGIIVYSPTDLAVAINCEFALLRRLDVKLGRAQALLVEDLLMQRAAELGDEHERRVLGEYVAVHGDAVVQLPPKADYSSTAAMHAAREATLDALSAKAPVVYQGAFFDGRMYGRSDFLVLRESAYAVLDTKLARHAKVTALLQLAAYADQLERYNIALHPEVSLILGDRTEKAYPVQELLAVYQHRRSRMEALLDGHLQGSGPAAWLDTRHCGRCDDCQAEAATSRDVLLVAGLRVTQRARLHEAGLRTVEQLAGSTGPVEGVNGTTLARLRAQARMQSEQDHRPCLADGRPDVHAEVIDSAPLLALPSPSPGDLFFDFEGDPLWTDASGKGGLEYLFGAIEADTGVFKTWLAHGREAERQATRRFLDYVVARRAAHPDMRIYHYANYERAALARLAADAEYGEDVVDDLFRHAVLVDLYSVVRQSVRVSQPSYSIKKLEPLYMSDQLRTGVDNAGDSVVEYARYCALVGAGKDAQAAEVLQGILDYNEYDCLSTQRLRDWLRALVPQPDDGRPAVQNAAASVPVPTVSDPLADDLRARAESLTPEDPDIRPLRLLASSLGYHAREDKPFWWEHFRRLREPIEEWGDGKDVFAVHDVLEVGSWVQEGRKLARRTVTMAGAWGSGSIPGSRAVPVFAVPCPDGFVIPDDGCRATGSESEVVCSTDALGRDVVRLTLALRKEQVPYDDLPVALVPAAPPSTTSLVAALHELGAAALHGLPDQAGVALLRRTVEPALPPDTDPERRIETVVAAVRLRERSYVAVQGPPGTGKTYLGARVVAALVAQGWKIGVVAQSHSVVSHFLDAVVIAGVSSAQVAKKPGAGPGRWTQITDSGYQKFLNASEGGCVLGGTAWDFVNLNRVQRNQLDLLVVDEAGQFSLANTLAASVGARRLLLLGDPNQLPQVSQGTHAEPVNESALAWLMEGATTLPPERGYFLPDTRRMHPAVAAKVSALSYDGRLAAWPGVVTERHLAGVEPGLHAVPLEHAGNDTSSPEEATEVVARLQSLLGLAWTPAAGAAPRPLAVDDVLVVAAYNAQVAEIRRQLTQAGLGGVLVGTVDKLQGREAAVVIVSLSASSAAEVPRGLDFLLSRNRLNVAVSRAQWATFVVHSPALADHLPTQPEGLQRLGAYLSLLEDRAAAPEVTSPPLPVVGEQGSPSAAP